MKKLLLFLLVCVQANSYSQSLWTKVEGRALSESAKISRKAMPSGYELYKLDLDALKSRLVNAPKRENNASANSVLISFPSAGGNFETYRIYEASVLHPDLAARFPAIKSYIGVSTAHQSSTIRFSVTIFGLHVMAFSNNGVSYIDPYSKDLKNYIVYAKSQLAQASHFECGVTGSARSSNTSANRSALSSTGIFRTYRLALSSTVEYSNFHIAAAGVQNGTDAEKKAAVMAAMAVTMTRVNGVYERDMSLTMQIVPNDDQLISIDTDNLTNDDGGALLGENQTLVDGIIGNANYDVGHIFSTGGGGVAFLGAVCNNDIKAGGVTGLGSPVGDAYDIDYVAHEMGHQFGADHTFNSNAGACNGNRSASTAVEPGSGTTIMAYAGICGAEDVQPHSDAHFSFISLNEMNSHVAGNGNCSVNVASGNAAPVIIPIPDYTIPKSTAFILKGNATDADNDGLSYCWEQSDLGTAFTLPSATNTASPNFRSLPPSESPDRYMPMLSSVIANNLTPAWEVVPAIARTMNFELTVRDNNLINGGQTAKDDIVVTVANVGPFLVTAPNTNVSWSAGSNQTVTWDVAGTTANGINTAYVDIYLSGNGGLSFPTLLASHVPNDGSQIVTTPATAGTANRIMVIGNGNIFYDVSNTNFTITAVAAPTFTIAASAANQFQAVCVGHDVVYNLDYATLNGFNSDVTLNAVGNPSGSTVTFSQNPINASGSVTITVSNITTPGNYEITINAVAGETKSVTVILSALSGTFQPITLSSPSNNAVGESVDETLVWVPDTVNATAYDVELATDPAFANVVQTATVSGNSYSASGLNSLTDYYWRVLPKNAACNGNYSEAYKFTTRYCNSSVSSDIPVAISDEGTSVVESTLLIPASANITIADVNVSLNISHTWVRDLTATLISPAGTEITLFTEICDGNPGNLDVDAIFDDSGALLTCGPSNPRISGVVVPTQLLAGLNGENSQGIWTLRVADDADGDGGSINSWSLNLCSEGAPLAVHLVAQTSVFSVYPNPNNGSFTVMSNKFQSGSVAISLYDMRGRVLFNKNYESKTMFRENIKLDGAQSGVYLLSVSDGKHNEVKRIVIK